MFISTQLRSAKHTKEQNVINKLENHIVIFYQYTVQIVHKMSTVNCDGIYRNAMPSCNISLITEPRK